MEELSRPSIRARGIEEQRKDRNQRLQDMPPIETSEIYQFGRKEGARCDALRNGGQ